MKHLPKIIVVCGPTGSGKTSLAVELCKKFDGEIINADSRQVYREMDIGTSKEVQTQMSNVKSQKLGVASPQYYIKEIPIHLINIIDPNERYNVGEFKKDAEEVITDIISRGKVPFMVGGTGLYIDALIENFSFQSISNLKSQNSKPNLKSKNLEELIEILENLDPDALNVVDLKNRRRVERAIEVCISTGVPFTKQRTKGERKYQILKLSPEISLNREKLYEKINKRVDQMISEGLEEEVRVLAEKYGWESEAMTGIGYREWNIFFVNSKSEIINSKQIPNNKSQIINDIKNVVEKIKQDTRNYAKRQMTWFKRDKEIYYVKLSEAEKLVKEFLR